jgi:hypothetical protein
VRSRVAPHLGSSWAVLDERVDTVTTLEERVERLEKEFAAFRAEVENAPIANANIVAAMEQRLREVEKRLEILD